MNWRKLANRRNITVCFDRKIRNRIRQEAYASQKMAATRRTSARQKAETIRELEAGREANITSTIQYAKTAYAEHESTQMINSFEFLAAQARLIQKRWWMSQAILLAALWCCIYFNGLESFSGQTMAVAAPLFGMIIIPELWKNRSCKAIEVEAAAYYSLRQIFTARILLFALVDLGFLSIFYGVASRTVGMSPGQFIADFLLPLTVTCCICFYTMINRYLNSEYMAILLSVVWSGCWMLIVGNEWIYQAIALPTWIGMWLFAIFVLIVCVIRSQRICERYWEVEYLCN